jgi:hypothetical protein
MKEAELLAAFGHSLGLVNGEDGSRLRTCSADERDHGGP